MSRAVEEWLAEHTFECPVGRVSPAQCERNRGKPSLREYNWLGDKKELYRKYPDWGGPKDGFKPAECEVCRDWEVRIREFHEKKGKIHERGEEMARKKNEAGASKAKPFSERKNMNVQVNFKGWEEVWEALNRAAYEECRLLSHQVIYAVKSYLESRGYLAKKAVPGGACGEEAPAGEAGK